MNVNKLKIVVAGQAGCGKTTVSALIEKTLRDERQEGNVVYLHKSSNPEKWVPPEL